MTFSFSQGRLNKLGRRATTFIGHIWRIFDQIGIPCGETFRERKYGPAWTHRKRTSMRTAATTAARAVTTIARATARAARTAAATAAARARTRAARAVAAARTKVLVCGGIDFRHTGSSPVHTTRIKRSTLPKEFCFLLGDSSVPPHITANRNGRGGSRGVRRGDITVFRDIALMH